jgi:hypothetical protein
MKKQKIIKIKSKGSLASSPAKKKKIVKKVTTDLTDHY